ncbi:polysaccharide deacetylase family protein [Candidatus Sumerlaeota bacterium]|nr:polysaccharide deacetylase family protein [Candidatus Sumerlaeota bacterium]
MSPIHVITYHAIDDATSPLAISLERFRNQLRAWRQHGYNFLSIAEFASQMNSGELGGGSKEILLTFDDALESVYTRAFPLLQEMRIPAVVFLVADYMGKNNGWPSQPAHAPRWPIMSWQCAEEMGRYGIGFGSHTCAHPDLRSLSPPELARELEQSKMRIEDRLGVAVGSVAYPYGACNSAVCAAAERSYGFAFGTRLASCAEGNPRMNLPRLDAHYLRPAWVYQNVGSPRVRRYLALRRTIRSLRGK